MITTGHPASPNTTKTEIVDVVSGEVCEDLAVFPIQNCSDAVGANLDGTPVVCGGYYFGTHHKICYKLTINGWQEFASMKDHRGLAAAVMFQKKFHVFGGALNSLNVTLSEMAFIEYPQGSKRQSSIFIPGTSLSIPAF